MNSELRYAWTELVSADDIDEHLRDVGQAQANAELLTSMLAAASGELHQRVLIPGGGTAQFLDYVDVSKFQADDITLTDINPAFLTRARERFIRAGKANTNFLLDDIENTKLTGPFDIAVLVLVLEHIDWRLGLQNVSRLKPSCLIIIIQRNPANLSSAIAPRRQLNRSMQAFSVHAAPTLISAGQLIDFLNNLGFDLHSCSERAVGDGKTMVGFRFNRKN